jgi:hypothetical protein
LESPSKGDDGLKIDEKDILVQSLANIPPRIINPYIKKGNPSLPDVLHQTLQSVRASRRK